jgi:hypothetical protein
LRQHRRRPDADADRRRQPGRLDAGGAFVRLVRRRDGNKQRD